MEQNKVVKWLKEHKHEIGCFVGFVGFGVCMAGIGYSVSDMRNKNPFGSNWIGFNLGEDTTVNIFDLFSSSSMDNHVGHMVIDADYDMSNGFQTYNMAFDAIKLS